MVILAQINPATDNLKLTSPDSTKIGHFRPYHNPLVKPGINSEFDKKDQHLTIFSRQWSTQTRNSSTGSEIIKSFFYDINKNKISFGSLPIKFLVKKFEKFRKSMNHRLWLTNWIDLCWIVKLFAHDKRALNLKQTKCQIWNDCYFVPNAVHLSNSFLWECYSDSLVGNKSRPVISMLATDVGDEMCCWQVDKSMPTIGCWWRFWPFWSPTFPIF